MRPYTALLSLLLAMLPFSGCSTPQPTPVAEKAKELPSWYLSPPANNGSFLYGVGEGSSMDEATKRGLESMVAQLGISITSSYTSSTTVNRGYREYFQKSTVSDIKSEIAQIRISNYEVIETRQQRYNHFIVLVRSDRELFAAALKKELAMKFEQIDRQSRLLATSDILTRYGFFNQTRRELDHHWSTLLLLNTLEPSFDDAAYLASIKQIEASFQTLRSNLSFAIHATAQARRFAEVIRVALSDEALRVVDGQGKNADTVEIFLHASEQYAGSYGFDIARVILDVDIKTDSGKSIGGNRISITGQATQGMEVALDNAAAKLARQFKTDGLAKTLGLMMLAE